MCGQCVGARSRKHSLGWGVRINDSVKGLTAYIVKQELLLEVEFAMWPSHVVFPRLPSCLAVSFTKRRGQRARQNNQQQQRIWHRIAVARVLFAKCLHERGTLHSHVFLRNIGMCRRVE